MHLLEQPNRANHPPIVVSDNILALDSEGMVTIRSRIFLDTELKVYIDDVLRHEPIRKLPQTGEWSIRLPLESGTYLLRIEDPQGNSVETDLVVMDA